VGLCFCGTTTCRLQKESRRRQPGERESSGSGRETRDVRKAAQGIQGFQELVSPVSDFMYMVGSIPRYSNFQDLLMSIFLMFLLV